MSDTDPFVAACRDTYQQAARPPTLVTAGRVRVGVARNRHRKRGIAGGLVVGMAASAAAVGVIQSGGSEGPVLASPTVRVQPNTALEYFASGMAQDWVTSADHVVVADVIYEEAGAVDGGADGESDAATMVSRSVTLEVEETLWSSPEARRALGGTVNVTAAGWMNDGEGRAVPLAWPGTPRLEVGHRYVFALTWMPGLCASDGDPAEPAQWMPLGSGAVIPADGDQLGVGESEGRAVNGDRDQAAPGTLESRLLGKDVSALPPLLSGLTPGPRPRLPGDRCE